MTSTVFRAALGAVVAAGSLAACSRSARQPGVIGPELGESTAPGPSDPTAPPPDAPGVTELSVPFQGAGQVGPSPAPTADTPPAMVPTQQGTPGEAVRPGATTAPAPPSSEPVTGNPPVLPVPTTPSVPAPTTPPVPAPTTPATATPTHRSSRREP